MLMSFSVFVNNTVLKIYNAEIRSYEIGIKKIKKNQEIIKSLHSLIEDQNQFQLQP